MKFFVNLALVLGLFLAVPEEAEAQSACETYRVKRGDSLRDIAKIAYGGKEFRHIYRVNRDVIGRNPNVLPLGIVLRLPCLDGSLPEVVEHPNAITFATANGYPPYTGEALLNRGIFTHLVSEAMQRAGLAEHADDRDRPWRVGASGPEQL